MKIKVSELFYSLQGEGRYMGVPSVFLRTFGCNFTCSGFGMPTGEKSDERNRVAEKIEVFKEYKDLPLVSTGCDSYASWDPRFKHLSPVLSVDDLATAIVDLLPKKEWQREHLVITGGEPLLGWQKSYPALLDAPNMVNLEELTFETNGTQFLETYLSEYLYHSFDYDKLTFSVSPKLPCSGESWENAIRPEVILDYQEIGTTYLKFVVGTGQDVEDAKQAYDQYKDAGFEGDVYLMPVGGEESMYTLNKRTVAEFAMKLGWRYSDRLQIPLWKNAWGT